MLYNNTLDFNNTYFCFIYISSSIYLVTLCSSLKFCRFKECLMEERRALLQEVSVLERKTAKMKFLREISTQSAVRPPQDTAIHDR